MSRTALLLIDVQNDFCPGGKLAVPDGDAVVGPCNALIAEHELVLLTADWHPAAHSSFASTHGRPVYDTVQLDYGEQLLWPDHCVQGSDGAAFHPDLHTDAARMILRKGSDPQIDSYSAFFENDRRTRTGLHGALQRLDVSHLVMAGLATDYCVMYSALDARSLGYSVEIPMAAVRGIDSGGSLSRALQSLREAGVSLI